MIWGAYGANAVHMSFLQEYMAGMLRLRVGQYYQYSNNLHAYVDVLEKLRDMQPDYEPYLTISDGEYESPPLVTNPHSFDRELKEWFGAERTDFENSYLGTTATRIKKAWRMWKSVDVKTAIARAKEIHDRAWRKACVEWLQRRDNGK